MTTDLFERYDLESIAASVARTGENGEKKKVRKTYKNYMRNLTGAFDVEKKDEGSPDTMLFMMQLPQEEWDATTGRAARVEKGLTDEASANLGKAMTMTRGGIPRSMWNPNVLGELTSTTAAAPTKATIGGVKRPMQAMQTAPGARVIKEEAARPKRNKKPRKYGDETFEGYGEGFVDDDLQDGAYSGGDGEDGSGARKRFKKVWHILQDLKFEANQRKEPYCSAFPRTITAEQLRPWYGWSLKGCRKGLPFYEYTLQIWPRHIELCSLQHLIPPDRHGRCMARRGIATD